MKKILAAVILSLIACAHGLPVRAVESQTLAVKFVDADSSVIWTDRVKAGECACPPSDPVKFGHDFAGWSDGSSVKSYAEIDRLTVTAAKTWRATYAPHAGRRLRVGVYSGPGANGAAALNVHRLFGSNPRIEYVSVQTNRVQEGAFMDRLDMFLIPGGTTKLMYGQLGKTGRDNIAKFVRRDGGRYFGICAGTAFQMNDASGTHMGLAPFKITAQICRREVTVELTERGREIFGGLGWDGSVDNRICYSNSPIMFDAPGGFKKGTYHFDVIATYKSGLNGKFIGRYAMVAGTNCLGRLFLTAPHPEVYEESRKFITTGIRWLFDKGVPRNGATAAELKAASTGLAFALPAKGAGALKVAYGPASFTARGAEELLGLVRTIDQHADYALTPMSADNLKAGRLDGYDALVVPRSCGRYSSDAVTAFKAAGGKVLYEDDGDAEVMHGLRRIFKIGGSGS